MEQQLDEDRRGTDRRKVVPRTEDHSYTGPERRKHERRSTSDQRN